MRYKQKAILFLAAVITPVWPPAVIPNAAPPPLPPAATFAPGVPNAAPPPLAPTAEFRPATPTPRPVPTPCSKGICPVPTFTIEPLPCDYFPSLICLRPADGVYVVLGDSLALGLFGTPGYAAIYEDHIEDTGNREIDSRNLARSGWHSSQLAAALQHDPVFRQQVAEADIITWNIGGNDLRVARDLFHRGQCGGENNTRCLERAVTAFKNNWNVIIQELQTLRKSERVLLITMDLYNPFIKEDMARGTFATLDPYFDRVNAHITSTLHAVDIPFARVSTIFNGPQGLEDPADKGFISFDGYHPNSAGHRVIASALIQLGATPLPKPRPTPTRLPIPTPLPTLTPPPTPRPIPNPWPTPECLAPCYIDASGNITCICSGI